MLAREPHAPTMDDLIAGRHVLVCVGPGGVGKTTTAAAVGAELARRGGRVAVLTIDPARRLAQSLGLEELGGEASRVDPDAFAAVGVEMHGELWAMMLDAKRTFDELVERYAPDPQARDRLLSNRIYQEISTAVSGSQEYMAMEKLYELEEERRYDVLVLDTPPTRNALDFLDAPSRLARFIDSRALGVFLRPGGRFLGRGSSIFFRTLQRVTGVDVMEDISDFFAAIGDMAQGFRERAARVERLLSAPTTGFVLVTSPRPDAVEEALYFRRRLVERRMPFAGTVVNRVSVLPAEAEHHVAHEDLGPLIGDALTTKVLRTVADARRLGERDERAVARLESDLGRAPLMRVPELEEDVHDIAGLEALNAHLFP